MRVGIIGAGAAGLNSARQLLANDVDCLIFEQTGELGGTWVYTDQVGCDKYGIPIHTSMYQNLRTNLPKEVMGYPDFPFDEMNISYVSQEVVLDFLHKYANRFELNNLIKYYNQVQSVKPLPDERWELISMNVKTKTTERFEFDALLVCNGHYHNPYIPILKGIDLFKGKQMHSHDYRSADVFKGQRVLVLGGGPSGVDLTFQISHKAERVILSHHLKEVIATQFPKHVTQKPDIDVVKYNEVIFKDGTSEEIDTIFYCTGYRYTFPFLNEECGIEVENNYVKPLYKHVVNINHPTMALIGLPFYVCAFPMFDIQTRFFVETLTGRFKLPSKEDMQKDTDNEMNMRWERGLIKRQAHMMGPEQQNYYDDLSNTAKIKSLPPVVTKLHNESSRRFLEDLIHYRDDVYELINDEEFRQLQFGKKEFCKVDTSNIKYCNKH